MREYLVLGPIEVRRDGIRLELGPPKQRAVLGALLLARGGVVSVDRLAAAVWGDEPPAAATTSLQAYISNLRRTLRHGGEPSPIERVATGYRIDVADDRLDIDEFVRLLGTARAARDSGRWEDAQTAVAAALACWRGDEIGGFADAVSWVGAETASLAEMRVSAVEINISALLAVGDTGAALSEIVALRAHDRLRSRTTWLHMVALYRAGRATEALDVYTEHLRLLDTELGLDPDTELVSLQRAILQHDPVIAAWPRPPHWSGATAVTVPAEAATTTDDGSDDLASAVVSADAATLVGRDDQLGQLRSVLRDSGAGTRWVTLSGPAGIGKTRLAEEAARLSEEAGARVVWIRCPEAAGVPAWWPLRQLCRALDVDPADVLSIPAGVDADTARFAVYERIQDMLTAAAGDTQLTLIIDDAQWADSMTLGLLPYLTTTLRDAPIVVVSTIRNEEGGNDIERFRQSVTRVGGLTLEIDELARAEVALLVRQVAGDELPPADLDALTRRTGGNPLFVSEFARLPPEERHSALIPAIVRSVLGRRLGALDPVVLEVIGHAAVLGEEVDVGLLSSVMDRSVAELADCVDEAIDERILVVGRDGGQARFAHALLREEALATIRPLRRCRIHQRAAEILGAPGVADATVRRATHLLAALPVAESSDVVAACRAAADEAAARWDSESAAYWLGAALRTHEAESAEGSARDERADLLVDLLTAQARAGRMQVVFDTAEAAIREAVLRDDADTIGRLAAVLIRAGGAWPWIGPHTDNSGMQSALELAEDYVGDNAPAAARVLAAAAIGQCYHRDAAVPAGLLARAHDHAAGCEDAVVADVILAELITYSGIADHAADAEGLAHTLVALQYPDRDVDTVITDAILTMSTMTLADVDATWRHMRRGILGSERLHLPIVRAQLRWMEATLAVWNGRFDDARKHFRTAVAVHEQTELYVAGSGALAMMALATERGLLEEFVDTGGLDPLTWARSVAESFTDNQVVMLLAAGVARIAGTAGDPDLARTMTVAWLGDRRAPVWTSLAQAVLLAHVVAELGFIEYARQFIDYLLPHRHCIATVGQVGCVGPVALALAELFYLVDDADRGDELLAQAERIARSGGGTPTVLRCRLLAARRQPPSPRRGETIAAIEAEAMSLGLEQLAQKAHETLASC